jgi:hypothetical protein
MARTMKGDMTGVRSWQYRGRCRDCGTKAAGCRRIRTCACGGKVVAG